MDSIPQWGICQDVAALCDQDVCANIFERGEATFKVGPLRRLFGGQGAVPDYGLQAGPSATSLSFECVGATGSYQPSWFAVDAFQTLLVSLVPGAAVAVVLSDPAPKYQRHMTPSRVGS